jgi:hypothetical protein
VTARLLALCSEIAAHVDYHRTRCDVSDVIGCAASAVDCPTCQAAAGMLCRGPLVSPDLRARVAGYACALRSEAMTHTAVATALRADILAAATTADVRFLAAALAEVEPPRSPAVTPWDEA